MSRPQTRPAIPVPIPIRGLNRLDPLAAMDPAYGTWIVDVEPEPQYLRARNTYRIHADLSGDVSTCLGLLVHKSELFVYTQGPSGFNDIYDVTTSTPALDHTTGSSSADEAYQIDHAGKSYFATEFDFANCSRYYNGTTWTSYGFTESAASVGSGINTSFRGRFYIFGSRTAYYSAIGGLTGATTEWNIDELISSPGGVIWAATLASSTDVGNEQYLAFGNQDGEILVYSGDNPDAANWELIARFKISPPLFYNCILEYRNDLWIATTTGMVSLRKLFQFGSQTQEQVSVSSKIDPYWAELVRNVIANNTNTIDTRCSLAFWPEQNKVYVLIRGHVLVNGVYQDTEATMFVYNGFSEAWVPHRLIYVDGSLLGSLKYFENALYFCCGDKVMIYDGVDNSGDEEYDNPGTVHGFVYDIRSAYTNLGNADRYKHLTAVEPVIKTDTDGGLIRVAVEADFGRVSTSQTFQSLPTSQTFHFPTYIVGVQGSYLQWKLSGTTPTDDPDCVLELYSMGLVVK